MGPRELPEGDDRGKEGGRNWRRGFGGVQEESREVWDPVGRGAPGWVGERMGTLAQRVSGSPRLLCCIGMGRFKITRFEGLKHDGFVCNDCDL